MMPPKIHICPIAKLYDILAEEHGPSENTVAILCTSSKENEQQVPVPHITEVFDDLDSEIAGRSLSYPAAQRMARFIRQIDSTVDTVYVCCDSGMSRSSAVAAVVHRYFSLRDMHIWNSPHYHPNPLVYRMLSECLDMPVDEDSLNRLITINRLAYRNTRKKTIASPHGTESP